VPPETAKFGLAEPKLSPCRRCGAPHTMMALDKYGTCADCRAAAKKAKP
jgi:hypothetical protein